MNAISSRLPWSRSARLTASGLALAVAVSVSACSADTDTDTDASATADVEASPTAVSAEPEPESVEVYGAVGLGPGAVIPGMPEEGQCSAHSEYTDIKEGVQVEILDADGSVAAVGELGPGTIQDGGDCAWIFTIDAPAGGSFYQARVLDWESELVAEDDLATEVLVVLPAG